MTGPLAGTRVIDLTTVVLGPLATQIFGDLGADIIKVEPPGGDSNRFLGPGRHAGMSGIAMNLHRNKRSIVLDLKKKAGRDVVVELIRTADVLIHNIRPAGMERLGLAWTDLKDVNPRLIYCMVTGFAADGPYGGKPAYDDLIQGASGIADLFARLTGQPAYFPSTICDKITGITAVYAVLAALLQRHESGRGQLVEVPMLETMVAFNLVEHLAESTFEPRTEAVGYARALSPYRRPYRTKDGYVCLLPYTDNHWQDFFATADRPELSRDRRFADIASRTAHIDALYAIVEELVRARSTDEWMELCGRLNIPCMKVLDLDRVDEDPHLAAVDFLSLTRHPSEGLYRSIGRPISFSDNPDSTPRPAPNIGQQSREILAEVGYGDAEIDELMRQGVTSGPQPEFDIEERG